MKKIYTFLFSLSVIMGLSQTATNFNVNDCSGNNHDLFNELNSGKVIVIAWVMPCTACIAPALSAYTEVQNLQSSFPGKVKFYLVDDYANTSCPSLTSWGNTNGMTNSTVFSNAAIDMSHYGTAGMPKIVILGGASHTVFDNQNNSLNTTQFNAAMSQALLASAIGINEMNYTKTTMSVYPNPVSSDHFKISYTLSESTNVKIEIYNILGALVKEVLNENQITGAHEINIESTLKNGTYFVKIKNGNKETSSKLVINR